MINWRSDMAAAPRGDWVLVWRHDEVPDEFPRPANVVRIELNGLTAWDGTASRLLGIYSHWAPIDRPAGP